MAIHLPRRFHFSPHLSGISMISEQPVNKWPHDFRTSYYRALISWLAAQAECTKIPVGISHGERIRIFCHNINSTKFPTKKEKKRARQINLAFQVHLTKKRQIHDFRISNGRMWPLFTPSSTSWLLYDFQWRNQKPGFQCISSAKSSPRKASH